MSSNEPVAKGKSVVGSPQKAATLLTFTKARSAEVPFRLCSNADKDITAAGTKHTTLQMNGMPKPKKITTTAIKKAPANTKVRSFQSKMNVTNVEKRVKLYQVRFFL